MTDMPDDLLIFGFGGHARSVADVALSGGVRRIIFVDPNARVGEEFAGHPAFVDVPDLAGQAIKAFPAMGQGAMREAAMQTAKAMGLAVARVLSPRSSIGVLADIGEATFVGHQAHVGPRAAIGIGVIVNSGAVVEHDCRIGDFTHVSVNTTVAGSARIGRRCFIGAGATVIDRVTIGDDVVVGAGAVVIRDLAEPGTYVGQPARRIR